MGGRAIRWVLPVVLLAAAGVGAALAATSMHSGRATVKTVKSSSFGTILVSSSGRTLYRYTPDKRRLSTCKASCLAFWPPLLVKAKARPTAGAGAKAALLGTIKAAHGMQQVTYAGFPLYFFAADKKAGQVKGEGYGGKWYVVATNGALVRHAVMSTGTTTSGTSGGGGGAWG